jgi:DNA-directed RNA polymerase subunit beta
MPKRNYEKKSYAHNTAPLELPTLIDVQLDSFEAFIKEGLSELFEEISPIESFQWQPQALFSQ